MFAGDSLCGTHLMAFLRIFSWCIKTDFTVFFDNPTFSAIYEVEALELSSKKDLTRTGSTISGLLPGGLNRWISKVFVRILKNHSRIVRGSGVTGP
jgi:hypothetical protein